MMTELLKNKSTDEALFAIQHFRQMVSGEDYDEEILDECISLQGVSQVPPRINCAMLAWNAAEAGIQRIEEDGEDKTDTTITL